MSGCTTNPERGAAIHSSGTCSSPAPRLWKIQLTLAFCSAKPNCSPRNPKHMFQICQKDNSGFACGICGYYAFSSLPAKAPRFMHTARSRSTALVLSCLFLCVTLDCREASAQAPAAPQVPWWRNAVIYEIYPRSFQDSNGDGIGDLNGVTQRLGYLESLGVDAIWIAPCYPSPQVDFGYDISDYQAIDPVYGTLADFDHLLAEAGRHHIRVILDMVLNHTSDRHPWFIASASSRSDPRHDFYVWSDGRTDAAGHHLPPKIGRA